MLTEIYIEALPVDEDLADQVWELWNAGLLSDNLAAWAWWITTNALINSSPSYNRSTRPRQEPICTGTIAATAGQRAARMSEKGDIVFDFKLQVRSTDEEGLGIEDATAVWDEEAFPFVSVATITIPAPQDVGTERAKEECEQLVFRPWHSLESHRPLGSINRLRKQVYETSADHRETPWKR